ncbi:hypothetical protein [Erwinia rhapontici]|uniref:hypothetical protein n=1 Tax=Erwinia rhapontici TaxID=55212 RepID=UPI003B9F7F36
MDLSSQSNQFMGVLALTFSIFCSDAMAGYNNIVWGGQVGSKPVIPIGPLDNDKFYSDFTVSPVSGDTPMIAIDAQCVGFTNATKTITTQWMMYPSKGNYQGLRWSLTMNSAGAGGPYRGSELGGSADDMLVPFSQVTTPASDQGCLYTGVRYSWNIPSQGVLTGSLTVSSTQAVPGVYHFSIPMVWGVEENKYAGSYGDISKRMGAILSKALKMSIPVTYTHRLKCIFDTSDITLNHGDIEIRPGDGAYFSNVYPLNITCENYNAYVNVELIGSTPVSGETRNYTSCGKGSSCRLTFDVDGKKLRYNETLNINKSTMTVNVKSTYMPNRNPVAGKFEGSGIIRITIL